MIDIKSTFNGYVVVDRDPVLDEATDLGIAINSSKVVSCTGTIVVAPTEAPENPLGHVVYPGTRIMWVSGAERYYDSGSEDRILVRLIDLIGTIE